MSGRENTDHASHPSESPWPESISEGSSFRLLDASEVAAMLNVPTRWVRDRSREGSIPCVRLGRYVRYRREAVLAWIEANEVEGRGRK